MKKYEAMLDQLDDVWARAEAALHELRQVKPTSAKDGIQVGKAMAMLYTSAAAAKEAASVLGRTSPDLWQ